MAIRSPETNETWVVSAGPSAEEFETLKGVRSDADPEVDSIQSLHRLEWSYIQRVLSDCGGNISAAARKLGIHRRSLQRKLARCRPSDKSGPGFNPADKDPIVRIRWRRGWTLMAADPVVRVEIPRP